jgi:Anti-sigma-K factor rskA
MTEERDMSEMERLLRKVPAPEEVPPGLEGVARAAALDAARPPEVAAAPVQRAPARRRWLWRGRLLPAAVILAGAAAASLYIGVGGRNQPIGVQTTVNLAAVHPIASAAGAHGTLKVGYTSGSMRPVVFKVSGLPPAPNGHYYEMWFSDGAQQEGLLAFDTGQNGSVTVHGEIPAGMAWQHCWVTLEGTSSQDDGGTPILAST